MDPDRAAEDAADRLRLIEQARTLAAMDIWIQNGGPPPAARSRDFGEAVDAQAAIEAEIDRRVGFRADGTPVPASRDIDRVPEHHQAVTLYEWTFYPEHDNREESSSSAYRAARKKLVAKGTCLVCGVGKDTLAVPDKNPFKAKQMETHHRVIEWALSEAIELARFNERYVTRRRAADPSDPTYDHDFSQAELMAWIDHHPDNLWVLCDVHHRGAFMGIHAITRPHWDPQDLVFPKFWNRTPPPEEDPRKKKPKPKG